MSTNLAPNARSVNAPGRRTIFSMSGMCAVRCPMEVTVEDGRVKWLQGNGHDKVMGTSRCAKGAAGIAFEYDDQRPQTPAHRDYIRKRLPEHMAAHLDREISPAAARQRGDRPAVAQR